MGLHRDVTIHEPRGIAEVLSAVAVPQRGLEIKVQLREGRLERGPASLTRREGRSMLVSIRYAAIIDFEDPARLEPDVYFIGVTGVELDDVEVGQLIIQPPSSERDRTLPTRL